MVETDEGFDLGPLTWVKAEVDAALDAAKTALSEWNGEDVDPLMAAQAYVHQVSGALTIVDLQGVARVCAEIERLLAGMIEREDLRTRASAQIASEACAVVQSFLDGLLRGLPNAELGLAPVLTQLMMQRGVEPPAPSELFYPPLEVRVRRPESAPTMEPTAWTDAVRRVRRTYQKGLLQFLLQPHDPSGLMLMDQAVRELERLAPETGQHYTFWWLATGLVESLRRGALPVDNWVRRVCARIDLQMRRLIEGSLQLAERLQRDVLYYLAQDRSSGGRAEEARSLFRLDRYLPPPLSPEPSVANLHNQLDALRAALETAKDHWMRLCSGHPDSLAPFQAATMSMFETGSHLPNESLQKLLRMVEAVSKRLPSLADTARNEALQLEMATALLLLEDALGHFEALSGEFDRQADVLTQRLQAAIDPSYDVSRIPTDIPLLDAVSRQAQEKLILAQVTQEIQTNLHQVEEILDRFFRDPTQRSQLPLVPAMMKQIQGALSILQLDAATELTKASLAHIERFADPQYVISPEELDWVADALSTLGLYMEAVRYGRNDPQQLLSLLARREALPAPAASVEAELRRALSSLQQRLAQAVELDEAARHQLRAELDRLMRDADLVGDVHLKAQVERALALLTSGATTDSVLGALQATGTASPTSSVARATSLAGTPAEATDAEMLQVYIEEAHDVLSEITAQLARLQVNLFDHDAFVTIRRGFHTLKGSGRMVGLHELAEMAWQVEDTLNHWLRAERTPTPQLLDFIDRAVADFGAWVQVLEAGGNPQVHDEALLAQAVVLRGQASARGGTSSPKPEAGTPAEPPAAGPQDQVEIGPQRLPAGLFAVFSEEAVQRVGELEQALARMARGHDAGAWEQFVRSAHTLAGIARTTGFTPLAEAVHAMETWAGAWPDKVGALTQEAVTALEQCVRQISTMVDEIRALRWPQPCPELAERLAALSTPATMPAAEDSGSSLQAPAIGPATAADAVVSLASPEEVSAASPPAQTPIQGCADRDATSVPASALEAAAEPIASLIAEPETEDDIDAQLLPIFLDEAAELMPRIGEQIRAWRSAPQALEHRTALLRDLHTLKGSARMAGAMRLGDATHHVESLLQAWGEQPATEAFIDQIEGEYDRLASLIDRLPSTKQQANEARPVAALPPMPTLEPPEAVSQEDLRLRQTLKLKANVLDLLLNEAGEVAIARARVESLLASYRQTAQELTANVERLRTQLRELEIQAETQMRSRLSQMDEAGQFDPLEFDRYTRLQELTRLLSESVNDVSTTQDNLLAGLDEAERSLHMQSRMTRNLQHELMRMRMMPFATLSERLHRVVRQTAKELGRKAHLQIEGGRTELDRSVLDRIAAPLEHLLRNAVAHGIEPPGQRLAAGKPEYGEIRLTLQQEGNEIVIALADDGAGIDFAAVRARAEALGWLGPEANTSREQLEAFLFTPGFSTAREVSEVAGRGIGLDVVRNEIAAIGGRVRLHTEAGRGTRFVIRLPLTLAVTPVVLARAGGQTFALPANMVAMVRELRREEYDQVRARGDIVIGEERYPLRSLAELVDLTAQPAEGRYRTVLLLRSGPERLALYIDALEGNLDAVVKNTGPQIARIPGIVGATVLGDGRIALILNPFALAEWVPEGRSAQQTQPNLQASDAAPLVLVVDDSLTVRKVTSRLLQREGYRVATAKDGVEALELLQDLRPALILLDIEMPRMDGYEVTRAVRADARLKHVPIVMVTSRTAEKHRQLALSLGVNEYLGKPYDEQVLLAAIAQHTMAAAAA
ncbi:MAG: Hpt domain-containing protein [Burkholderiales bacterium]|nr:Hpt domain-containing protein [Burkholderiales bacterium]